MLRMRWRTARRSVPTLGALDGAVEAGGSRAWIRIFVKTAGGHDEGVQAGELAQRRRGLDRVAQSRLATDGQLEGPVCLHPDAVHNNWHSVYRFGDADA